MHLSTSSCTENVEKGCNTASEQRDGARIEVHGTEMTHPLVKVHSERSPFLAIF